jgi:adenylate kinase family enzyme
VLRPCQNPCMRRVLVIGCGGAGKSTLAVELGRRLNLPVVHLDRLFWKPGWVQVPTDEWTKTVGELVQEDAWVMDGNYGGTLPVRLDRADTVIYFDFPTWLCLWRVVRRRIVFHGKTRPDVGPGCPEQIDWEFLTWIATFRRKRRPEILKALEGREGLDVVVLRSPLDARRFLAGLGNKDHSD